MNTELYRDKRDAEAAGYVGYNNGPHLAIDLPKAMCENLSDSPTLSVRLPDGKIVTIAFIKEVGDNSYQCCDIVVHRKRKTGQGNSIQQAAFYGEGPVNGHCSLNDPVPTTVVSLSMAGD